MVQVPLLWWTETEWRPLQRCYRLGRSRSWTALSRPNKRAISSRTSTTRGPNRGECFPARKRRGFPFLCAYSQTRILVGVRPSVSLYNFNIKFNNNNAVVKLFSHPEITGQNRVRRENRFVAAHRSQAVRTTGSTTSMESQNKILKNPRK